MLAGNHGNNTKSACEVKNVNEAQLVAFIIRQNKQINGCRVTKFSVCAKSRRQMGSRMLLSLTHIASQLMRCANCSCAATSDTYGSCKCVVRGMSQICVHLTKTSNQSSLLLGCEIRFRLISGSDSNSRGKKRFTWCPTQGIFDSWRDQTFSNKVGFFLLKWQQQGTFASCIQLKLRPLHDSSPHILLLLDDIPSADTQSDSTSEEGALEQLFSSSTLKTPCTKGLLGAIVANWMRTWTEQTEQWRGCPSWCGNWATFFRHDLEDFCTLAAERQRELIKIVAIDWSSFSVRGSCLFRLTRRRTGMSSIKFASLCQSCGFNRSARCAALLTTKSSGNLDQSTRAVEGTTLKTIPPFLPATKMGAVTLIEETSVPPSPNLYLSASRVSSISCFRPKSSNKLL